MNTTEYIWMNGEFVKWEDAMVHVLTHTLHYGAGAFEGVRAYETSRGAAIFRLNDHTERLFYSTKCIGLELPYTVDEVNKATVECVRKNNLKHCYIRPLAYFGYGKMGLNPTGAPPQLIIACWPWGAYLPHEMVDLKVSSYIRIHPRSTIADAKIVGHYVNSILAVQELAGTKYHEALFLDDSGNIAEGPGENFFMIQDGKAYTPPLGTILNGITRNTAMELLRDMGIEVIEKSLSLDDVFQCEEAFFTGT
ncbi:MAG: branched-chain amino acid transaminase, partial [Bdellovibrionales bacterium]|nr:branched-chain amino acid transaminase [Bdellovibrionales bacterium]